MRAPGFSAAAGRGDSWGDSAGAADGVRGDREAGGGAGGRGEARGGRRGGRSPGSSAGLALWALAFSAGRGAIRGEIPRALRMAFAGIGRPEAAPAERGRLEGSGAGGRSPGIERRAGVAGRGVLRRSGAIRGEIPRAGREAGVDAGGREEASMGSATRRRIRRRVFSATGGIPGRLGRRCGGRGTGAGVAAGGRGQVPTGSAVRRRIRWRVSSATGGIPGRLGRRCGGRSRGSGGRRRRRRTPKKMPTGSVRRWRSGWGFPVPEAIPGRCGGRLRGTGDGNRRRWTRGGFEGISGPAAWCGGGCSRRPEEVPEAIPGRCGGRSRGRGAGFAAGGGGEDSTGSASRRRVPGRGSGRRAALADRFRKRRGGRSPGSGGRGCRRRLRGRLDGLGDPAAGAAAVALGGGRR